MSTDNTPSPGFSVLLAIHSSNVSERSRAFDLILVVFWKAVYKHIRRQWGKPVEDAKTLALGFFSRAMESDFYDQFEPNTKRMRTFLREQVDAFVSAIGDAALEPESMDLRFNEAEEELSRDPSDQQRSPEELFDGEWARSIFTLAIEQLHNLFESQGKLQHFRLFQRYDLQDRSSGESVSLEQVAQEFSLPLSDVALYLNDARQSLRSIILDLLRSFTSSDEEFRREARSLLGL